MEIAIVLFLGVWLSILAYWGTLRLKRILKI